jgi:gluconate 2-dehydrogenase gamma chain
MTKPVTGSGGPCESPGPDGIDRREAIRRIGIVVGGSLSAPTLAGLLAGCEAPGVGTFRARTLDRTLLRRVETIAELIIPATDTPGASAARVHEFIDTMLTDFYAAEARAQFLRELERVDSIATSIVGKGFDDASDEERILVLEAMDEEAFPDPDERPDALAAVQARVQGGDPPFMRTMKELTISGYYTSEVGQTVELRLVPYGSYEPDIPLDQVGRAWA